MVPPLPTKPKDDYLGDVDLPSSSESESEEEGERHKPLYTAEEKDRTFNSMVCLPNRTLCSTVYIDLQQCPCPAFWMTCLHQEQLRKHESSSCALGRSQGVLVKVASKDKLNTHAIQQDSTDDKSQHPHAYVWKGIWHNRGGEKWLTWRIYSQASGWDMKNLAGKKWWQIYGRLRRSTAPACMSMSFIRHSTNQSGFSLACVQASGRDMKKLADKERRQIEEAHRAKAAALRDDDNVFDVAYEQQGGEGQDVLSATDIKVCETQTSIHMEVLLTYPSTTLGTDCHEAFDS